MSTRILSRLQPPDTSYWAIIKLSLPVWISNVAIVGGATLDTLMTGHLGSTDLAAVAIGLAVSVSVFVALVGVMQGLSPIAGHSYGPGPPQKIGFELHQTIWLAILLAIIGMALMCYTPMWMTLTNSTGRVAEIATSFLLINAIGLPAAMAGRAYMAMNAAVSRPKVAMWIALSMLAVKAVTNYIFIFGWAFIPSFGGAGCAISSTINAFLSLFLYWVIWHYDSFYAKMRQKRISMPDRKALTNLLKLGIPIGLSAFFEVTSFTFMTIFISRLGADVVSAHQIVANLTSLFYMAPLAIGVTSSVLVSQSLGANSPETAKMATYKCLKFCICLAVFVSALLYFCKYFFVGLYTSDLDVIKVSTYLIGFASIYHVFDAVNCVGSFSMRGYRITFLPMVIYGVFLWGLGLGLGSILTFTDYLSPAPMGAAGYWTAITIGLTLSGNIVGVCAVYVARAFAHGHKVWLR